MAAKNTSLNRFDEVGWNRLDHLSRTSTNRTILAGIVHAKSACTPNAPSHHIRDNRIVAEVVYRAIQNNWNDVLQSCASSRHMTGREYADIITADKVFTEDVHTAILDSPAAESSSLMTMLYRNTPYPAVKAAASAARATLIRRSIDAIKADPEAYELEDGEEHYVVQSAVQKAIEIDRHDLVADLIATGLVGSTAAKHALEAAASFAEFERAMAAKHTLAA